MSIDVRELREACKILELSDDKCKVLADRLTTICVLPEEAAAPRRLSKWQLCIKEQRKGKPFDPHAMKELSKLYRASKCPTPEFAAKHGRD